MNDAQRRIIELVYTAYASDSGVLFGLPLDKKSIAEAIIIATLEMTNYENDS